MKKTTEKAGLGLQCLVYGSLRMTPLLSKEAAFPRCLVVIPVRQICPLEGPEVWALGAFLPRNGQLDSFATLYFPSPVYGGEKRRSSAFLITITLFRKNNL